MKTHRNKCLTATVLSVTLTLASVPMLSAESLFRFEFDEGSGGEIQATNGSLTGALGRPFSSDNVPTSNPSAPSGAAGDRSLTIVDPDGYLLMDGTGVAELYDFTKPLTVEGWINFPPTSASRNEAFVGFGRSWKFGWRANGQMAFTMFGVVDIESGAFAPIIDAWFHMAATWEPGIGVTFYLDGAEVAFVAETRNMAPPIHDWLGVGSAGTAEPINSSIDRVRVHQAKLDASELDSIASQPKAPLASTLVAFDFNESNPPFAGKGLVQRPTVFAQDEVIANASPDFVVESPSRMDGDTALMFDGNDRVVIQDPNQVLTLDETQNFTIQAWLKPGNQAGSKGVFFYSNGYGGALSAAITQAGNVMVTTLGRADTTTSAVFPRDGVWHHLGIIHENGIGYRIYIDGILSATTPYSAGVLTETRTQTSIYLGSESSGGLAYTGGLDRLEFLNEAIAPAELDYLAVPGVDPGAPELEIGTAVSMSWSTLATGFTLESSTDLNEPRTWSPVNVAPVVIGDKFYVLEPASDKKTFYRLVRPTAAE